MGEERIQNVAESIISKCITSVQVEDIMVCTEKVRGKT
jgi:DNA-binding protein